MAKTEKYERIFFEGSAKSRQSLPVGEDYERKGAFPTPGMFTGWHTAKRMSNADWPCFYAASSIGVCLRISMRPARVGNRRSSPNGKYEELNAGRQIG